MGESESAVVKIKSAISEIDAEDWDACANPSAASYNPFISHAFLACLELSGSVSPETGWLPQHLALYDANDQLVGALPCYLKNHSQGEYVFDYAWAQAFERAGGAYYPKLQCAVPFTPVPGRRFLTRPANESGTAPEELEKILAAGAIELAQRHEASSLHATFVDEDAWRRLGNFAFLQRIDQQFHWKNDDYDCFDAFLETLASRKRKTIRKERKTARASGLEIQHIRGNDIREEHWDAFYEFYVNTGLKKWGQPYLNRTFFSLLGEKMADDCLLILCKRDERYIAGALNFIGGDCLYGRYWGATEHYDCLHFEVCYYQAIDYAITHNIARVEAGAQGEHKLARGYLPTTTYSLHWLADERLEQAVATFLNREREHVKHAQEVLATYAPFKKNAPRDKTN